MPLIGSVLLTFALQLAVIYWAPLQKIFDTTALTLNELLLCIALSTTIFWAVEGKKCLRRVFSRKS
jgi:Ca2+-transporting ATPase